MHEIVELRLPVFELSKLSNVPLDALRGDVDEFGKTRVQWSETRRTPYSPFTADSAVLSEILLDVQRGDEFEKTRV